MFPQGLPGAGLLVLRLSLAPAVAAAILLLAAPAWVEAGVLALASAILFGVYTQPAALAGAALCVVVTFSVDGGLGWAAVVIGLNLIALAMIGPGAYSIDARLFGRKVIKLGRSDRVEPDDA